MAQKESLITPEFRVSFPHVFKARRNDLSEKDEFSVVALFKKGEDLKALQADALRAIKAKWGEDNKKWPKKLRSPFRDQAERAKTNDDGEEYLPDGYESGAIFLSLKCTRRPGLVNAKREPIIDETEFYPGCYARASVRAYAYEAKGNFGVAFGLNNIQKTRDGEPFSGIPKAEDEFTAIEGGGDSSLVDNPFGN